MVLDNVFKLYLHKAGRWSMLLLPVIVLFFQDKGLDMTQIFLLQSFFAASVVILEVPTWYIWDMLRRKDGLMIWSLFGLVGRILYHFASWFWTFAIAELALAFAYTFYSWSDTALLYDTLLCEWKEDEFKKTKWKFLAIGNFSEALWAVLWWFLATYWFRFLTSLQILFAIFVLLVSFTFHEPHRERYEIHEAWIGHLKRMIWETLSKKNWLSSLIFYSACTWVSTMFWVWIAQPYFEFLQIPLVWFWILRWVWNASVWFFSLYAHKFETFVSEKTLLFSFPLISVLWYVLMWSFPAIFLISCMFFFYGVRWVSWVIYADIVNRNVSSKERATIMSLQSLAFRFWFMLTWPMVWRVIDGYWILHWFYAAWLISLFLWIIWWFFLYRSNFIYTST